MFNRNQAKSVFQEVAQERNAQDAKWGIQNHSPEKWLAIAGEEFGEDAGEHSEEPE